MPYRVLVAEDEELERRALKLILGAEGMPELEILEAANGREALELVGEGPLDAAFLDIRMPGIDGIEAARRLRTSFPGLPIVFLTAHDSFDYARSALRLRVEDFLLKPASAEEVSGALRRALAAGAAEGLRDRSSRAAAEKLESAVAFLADELRGELAAGRMDQAGIERYFGLVGARLRAVLAFRRESPRAEAAPGKQAPFGRPSLGKAVAELIERCLSTAGCLALAGAGSALALCLVACPGEAGVLPAIIRRALEDTLERARAELGLSLLAGAALAMPGEGGPAVLELGQAARRAAVLAEGTRPIVLFSLASSASAPERSPTGIEGGLPAHRTALRALALMEARYAEELSLEQVAEELGVSPSHLSRLLARHGGLGFADCLARFRVERAKAFLLSDTMSVKEVAALVGFHDPAYFARVFRRFAGFSPAEYRSAPEGGQA